MSFTREINVRKLHFERMRFIDWTLIGQLLNKVLRLFEDCLWKSKIVWTLIENVFNIDWALIELWLNIGWTLAEYWLHIDWTLIKFGLCRNYKVTVMKYPIFQIMSSTQHMRSVQCGFWKCLERSSWQPISQPPTRCGEQNFGNSWAAGIFWYFRYRNLPHLI